MDAVPAGTIGGTYCGNPLACAAALKTIELMERDDLASAAFARWGEAPSAPMGRAKKYPMGNSP